MFSFGLGNDHQIDFWEANISLAIYEVSVFYWTRKFIALFAKAHHLPSWATRVQFKPHILFL